MERRIFAALLAFVMVLTLLPVRSMGSEHTCSANDWYDCDDTAHWQTCRYCYEQIGEKQPHTYSDNRCTVCGAVDPSHECIAGDWYNCDDNTHWQTCIYCYEQIGEKQPHTYSDNYCTVCGAVDPSHECVAGDLYAHDDSTHWQICRYCYEQIGRTQPHTYEHSRCTVCGTYSEDHAHNYVWTYWGSLQECSICGDYKTSTEHTHNYVKHVCEICGLLDSSQSPSSIAVGNNKNRQMTINLKFADGISFDLTLVGIAAGMGYDDDDGSGGCTGIIYTKEGVNLGGVYWFEWNSAKQYTVGYRSQNIEITGDNTADGDWFQAVTNAEKDGILVKEISYTDGDWTVTGKLYDGTNAMMTLDDDLTVLSLREIIIGDVNGDGNVNNYDRLLLSRWLAKWPEAVEQGIIEVAADVNCDGKVNNLDRVILSRHLAHWQGYETLGE